MPSTGTERFWQCYRNLPPAVRKIAQKNYQLFKADPRHPSLHLKRVGQFWSVRVGDNHRALAIETDGGFLWTWIGPHDEYERLIKRS